MGASDILSKSSGIPTIYQGFWIKKIFSKILYLGGSGSFVRTFSEIRKIVFLQIYQTKYSSLAITELKTYIFSISTY